MNENKDKKQTTKLLIALIIVCTLIVGFVGSLRTRLHIDEIWSYGLSNNNGSPFFFDYNYGIGDSILQSQDEFDYHNEQDYQDYFYHWHTAEYYHDYLTVQEDERFDYANVFANQTADTHPPLYYCLLHTICSLFPNTFSIWYGFGLNLLFYVGSLVFLYLITKEILKSEFLAIISMLLWGLSRSGVTEALFIRMYMMETFLALCLVYTYIKLIQNFNWKYIILSLLIEIAGFLTHYYYYILAFYLTLFTCLYFLIKKQYKKMFSCGFAGLFSVSISVFIFPAVIRHLTKGAWSNTTKNVLYHLLDFVCNLSVLINQVISFYSGIEINSDIIFYTLYLLYVLLGLTALCVLIKCLKKLERKELKEDFIKDFFINNTRKIISYFHEDKTELSILIIFFTTVLLTGITIAGLEPNMGEYTIRYLFVILPLFSILIIFLLNKLTEHYLSKTIFKAAILTCVLIMIICSNLFQRQVLLKLNQNAIEIPFTERNVIVANSASYIDHSFAVFYLDAKQVYPIDRVDYRFNDAITSLNNNETVLCLFNQNLITTNKIEEILSAITNIDYQYLTSCYYQLEINSLYHVYEITIK